MPPPLRGRGYDKGQVTGVHATPLATNYPAMPSTWLWPKRPTQMDRLYGPHVLGWWPMAQNKMSVAMIGQVEGRKLTLEVRPIYDIIINKIDLSKA